MLGGLYARMTKEEVLSHNYQLKELSRRDRAGMLWIVNGKKVRRPACFYYMVSRYSETQKKDPC